MTPNLEWYLKAIERELEQLSAGRFTGNIEFKVNWKEGVIANCNICLNRSIRKIEQSK